MQDEPRTGSTAIEYVLFRVGDIACALDIGSVQEINRQLDLTLVYQAPPYVRGIVNLRGQIVTIIDLGKKLGLAAGSSADDDESHRLYNVVVCTTNEPMGLLVYDVDDIITVSRNALLAPPPHVAAQLRDYLEGVLELHGELVVALDVERITRKEEKTGEWQ